jgi:hypothetical protein
VRKVKKAARRKAGAKGGIAGGRRLRLSRT